MNVDDYTPLINTATNAYPVYFQQVRMANPDTSFPANPREEILLDYNYAVVRPSTPPAGDVVVEGAPALNATDGLWYQTWTARDFTTEEAATELTNRQQGMSSQVDMLLDQAFGTPYSYDFGTTDGVQHIQIGTVDRVNLTSQRITAKAHVDASAPDTVMKIRTIENKTISLTATQYLVMGEAVSEYCQKLYEAAWALKDSIAAATTLATLPSLPAQITVS